jgi:hypothetical protein
MKSESVVNRMKKALAVNLPVSLPEPEVSLTVKPPVKHQVKPPVKFPVKFPVKPRVKLDIKKMVIPDKIDQGTLEWLTRCEFGENPYDRG